MRSNADWKAWGEIDPLYAVAAIPGKSKQGADPWTDTAFYEAGLRDWNAFRVLWEQYGLSRTNCLEIGCGAGRMTKHLSSYFDSVFAVDVSADMIERARAHVEASVAQFYVIDGLRLPLPESSVAAVFSTHVFQHLDSHCDAALYFQEIYRVMSVDATLMIHLPVVVWPWGPLHSLHKRIEALRAWTMRMKVTAQRRAWSYGLKKSPPMGVIWYEVDWLRRTLAGLRFTDIEVRIVYCDSAMAIQHPFLFARKPRTLGEKG